MRVFRNVFMAAAGCVLLFSGAVRAQSGDPAFPTPVTTNEISGVIPARDIGDPRQTTYYFVFNGNRGDVFINIVTNNFKGEIDVFTAQGLDPRTKITIFADNPERETGRVIYQRQPEKLILRIQGRTPNDDPATYTIKFAGSFAPITGAAAEVTNEFPDVLGERARDSNVSTAGAILPRKEPPVRTEEPPAVKEVAEEPEPSRAEAVIKAEELPADDAARSAPAAVEKPEPAAPSKPRVIVTDNLKPAEDEAREITLELGEKKKSEVSAVVTVERVVEPAEKAVEAERPGEKKLPAAEPDRAAAANPLANVFLRVEMKDGSRFERRMSDVSSVNVVEGKLTIVFSDGTVRRIDILAVQKMTIE